MLELRNVSFEVEGKHILRNINLTIDDNQFTVITGPNGGGKSTLAKIIMGIEKPTGGSILFDGEDITNMSIAQRAERKIGYVFQQPPRYILMSVRKLLSLAHGKELNEDRCCSYLSDVGLCSKDYLDRDVDGSLSGGEVKRIEIASILARDLKLSIFDEPEAGIDLWSFSMLVDSFQKFKENKDQTVVIISHQEKIIDLADELMIIADGKVQNKGTKEEIMPMIQGGSTSCGCPIKEVVLTNER